MPKSKKGSANTEPAEDTQKLYARAYAARLAKQVAEQLESSRRKATDGKKPNGKA
jgi:ribosomal protein L18E